MPAPRAQTLDMTSKAIASVTATEADLNRKTFASPEEFVATMLPMAEQAAKKLGVRSPLFSCASGIRDGLG